MKLYPSHLIVSAYREFAVSNAGSPATHIMSYGSAKLTTEAPITSHN